MIDILATEILVEMPGGGKPILSQANICIDRGTIHGIVGKSGAGKTTVIRCLAGLLPPSTGIVRHDDVDIYGSGQIAEANGRLAKDVSLLPQNPPATLNPRVKVRDSIIEPLRIAGVSLVDALSRVEETAFIAGLHPALLDRYPSGLSGGEARRAALARAMISRPKVLLLDEPQAGLDLPSQSKLLDLIVQLSESEKLTVVIVSHDLVAMSRVCRDLTVMDKGSITESGRSEQVISSPESEATRILVEAAGI